MAKSQYRSKRKVSGGKYHSYRKKKQRELAGTQTLTKIDKFKLKIKRVMGGNKKYAVLSSNIINAYNPKTKKNMKLKIIKVIENKANLNFQRGNLITKGAIVETEKGNVKVTSRPGQDGVLNGILLNDQKN